MKLQVWTPVDSMSFEKVEKIKAEAQNGWFCVLPRHIDMVTALVPGILIFELSGGQTRYIAIDSGVFVKCGGNVSISVRRAGRPADLGAVRSEAEKRFQEIKTKEQSTHALEAKLEAELVRRLLEFEKHA